MDETLSFYPVDDDMSELLDVHGLAHGQPYLGQVLPATTAIRKTAGPCGNALTFEAPRASDVWFVEIDSSGHQVVPLSVDFWVRLAPDRQRNRANILTRDQAFRNSADFSLSQIQDGDDARILIRTQSEFLDQFTCSGALDTESWHHIAVSIEDGMAMQLFVDGVRVEQMGDTVTYFNNAVKCQDSTFGLGVNMGQNQWPWIVGASNSASTPDESRISDFFVGGAIDNLRIRNAVFTEEEAMAIFAP